MNGEDRVIGAMRRLPTCALLLLAGLVGLPATPITAQPSAAAFGSSLRLAAGPTAGTGDLVGAPGDAGPGPDAALLAGSPTVEHPAAEHRRPLPHRPAAAGRAAPARQAELATGPARRLPGRPAGLAAPLRRGPPAQA
jgi:hypothetical protein